MAEPPRPFTVGDAPEIHGEVAGGGPPIVLCHGLTSTRRYVVHGSRALERAGHTVVLFDARGHGESGPAPAGQSYGYPEQVGDLELVVERTVGEGRFLLGGSSMGAHTSIAYALSHPERVSGLVLIGPAYPGRIDERSLERWDALAAALEEGGVEGFLGRLVEGEVDPAWRDSVLRFTRERMLLHRDLDAVAEALRRVPRSRPFDSLEELERIEVPALVVRSHDAADPGHPREVAETYAERLPRARLIGEAEGESPLAWQGGRLSREIAAFAAEVAESAR